MLKKITSRGFAWLWVAIAIIAIDRYSKNWIVDHLAFYEPLQLLSFFNLTLVYNTGAAFSFLHSASGWQNILLGSLAFIVSVVILYCLYKSPAKEWWFNTSLCFVLGGALGNAWDRIAYGSVIDFLDFHLGQWHFAIFNVADSAIFVGGVMLGLHWFCFSIKQKCTE